MAKEVSGDELLLGRGKVYFDRFDGSGAKTGERFLGNCTRFEITTEDDLRKRYSSATSSSPQMKSVNVRRTQSIAITMDQFNKENVALALMGTVSTYTQSAGSAANESPPTAQVKQGYWFPLVFRDVSNVVVTGSGGTPTHVAGTDYDVDAVSGRIYVIPGGGITDGDTLEVDYDYAAHTGATALPKVQSGVSNVIEGFMRFIGDPASGPVWEAEVWKVSFTPDGALGFIQDDFGEMPLKGEVLDDSTSHPSEPYFQAILLS